MAMNDSYAEVAPARAEIEVLKGPAVIEFGSPTCGHCRAAQPLIAAACERHPEVRHIKIADGIGRRLGRSFKVKLWPTLIFLRDGSEVVRLIRPTGVDAIRQALTQIDPAAAARTPVPEASPIQVKNPSLSQS